MPGRLFVRLISHRPDSTVQQGPRTERGAGRNTRSCLRRGAASNTTRVAQAAGITSAPQTGRRRGRRTDEAVPDYSCSNRSQRVPYSISGWSASSTPIDFVAAGPANSSPTRWRRTLVQIERQPLRLLLELAAISGKTNTVYRNVGRSGTASRNQRLPQSVSATVSTGTGCAAAPGVVTRSGPCGAWACLSRGRDAGL